MKKENRKRICYIANQGQHYRFPIFERMGKELSCHFYLGDKLKTPIKPFDYPQLSGYKKTLRNIYFGNFYWQKGAVSLALKNYDTYIFTGEPYCISTWIVCIISKLLKKRNIAWTHGWYGRESKIKKIIKKAYFSLFDEILLYNEYAIRLMAEEGINKDKMNCIANSLDSALQLAIRKTLKPSDIFFNHFGNNYPVVIYCGRIQQVKRIDILLKAIKSLKNDGRHINLVLVGKDVDSNSLETLAAEAGIEKQVWFFGPCYNEDILGSLFYNSYACVSPGNIGLTAIHCLSYGCPAITHNNFKHQMPEFEAIIPDKTGDFFEEGNIEDLKDKIIKWTKKSDNEREIIRNAAYEEVDKKWNTDYQMRVLQEVIFKNKK